VRRGKGPLRPPAPASKEEVRECGLQRIRGREANRGERRDALQRRLMETSLQKPTATAFRGPRRLLLCWKISRSDRCALAQSLRRH